MDPISLGVMGGGAVFSIISSLIAEAIAGGREAEAQALREKVAAQYGPELLAQVDGMVAQQVQGTGFDSIQEDAGLRDAALDTQRELRDVYDKGGFTDADKAALSLAQDTTARAAQGSYAGLANAMAQRGARDSGLDMALKTQVGQDSTNALANQTRAAQMDARGRALQALMSSGDLARGIRSDDYRASSDRARAADAINTFNATQRANTDWHKWGAKMDVLGNRGNALLGQAAGYQQQADNARGLGSKVAQTGLGASTTIFNAMTDAEKRKKGGA